MKVSEPFRVTGGTWVVNTPKGAKLFSDGIKAEQFYQKLKNGRKSSS